MALPNTGAISIGDIAAEFGGTVPHDLSEYYGVGAGIPTSGKISVSDFYGTSNATPIVATGGSVSTSGGYKYHTFTGNGTFTVTQTGSGSFGNTIQYLVVGGGGGGGMQNGANTGQMGGGGGGAGGRVDASFNPPVTSYSITIGPGGVGGAQTYDFPTNGGNSTAFGSTAYGGGAGGRTSGMAGMAGGCGGGSMGTSGGGAGSQGGNGGAGDGYTSLGGGGGGVGGNGGGGTSSTKGARGAPLTWYNGVTYGRGGEGGAKNGANPGGASYYGSGGDGGGNNGAAGNSGVVICRYPI